MNWGSHVLYYVPCHVIYLCTLSRDILCTYIVCDNHDFMIWLQGSALFWINIEPSGEVDTRLRWETCPILSGSKLGKVARNLNFLFLVSQEWSCFLLQSDVRKTLRSTNHDLQYPKFCIFTNTNDICNETLKFCFGGTKLVFVQTKSNEF